MTDQRTAIAEAFRNRLATLWKVEPSRLEVEVGPNYLHMRVDGEPPTTEQLMILQEDIQGTVSAARKAIN